MNNVKKLRENVGMTQRELADRVHVAQAAVANWERGAADPTWDKAPILAEALGCPLEALFVMPDGEEPEPRSAVSSFDPDAED